MSKSILSVLGTLTYVNPTEYRITPRRDTVSSVGIARGPSLPETTKGMTHVCIFRHALALDEVRVKFLPEYANGGHGPTSVGSKDKYNGDVKEVWFAGSHSDM
jgi:uncharacterized protein (DUF2235 family)